MFSYYLKLGWLSIRRNPLLSTLMIAAIAIGIGASMTIITVNYVMSSNPIPQKSDQLFYVQLDSWDPNNSYDDDDNLEPPDQLTYLDAKALMEAGKAFRQIASNRSGLVLEPQGEGERPFNVGSRNTWADFFPMFDLRFIYGNGWDDSADRNLERVVVLSKEINERVFGGEDSVGRSVRLNGMDYRVVGVLDEFLAVPKFYDVTNGAFNDTEEIYIPFNLAVEYNLPRNGNTSCWKPMGDDDTVLTSECIWIQFWAELRNDQEKQEYMAFLDAYVEQQKELGRFPRPLNNRLSNVMEWMENQEVVEDDARVMLGLSMLFLLVCLLNTIGLLLAKFLGKSGDISLRRALGASRSSMFIQHMIESGLIGLGGGIFGLALTWLGLRGIEMLFGEFVENLVGLDWVMVLTAIGLAIVSALLAGLYPTWRACRIAPASQLKIQ